MRRNRHYLPKLLVLVALIGLAATAARAGSLPVIGAGGNFNIKVVSLKEARFRNVIKQAYDFSCGSAALATLLTYHYANPVGEQAIFSDMYQQGDQEKIKREGFSLLDMKLYLARRGINSDGFRASLDKLHEVGIPAIALITTRGYRHFVVVKGISEAEVLVGDPALGAKTYKRDEFEKIWNGILFVVTQDIEVAKTRFNRTREWRVREKAPFGTALGRDGLATFTMLLPGNTDF